MSQYEKRVNNQTEGPSTPQQFVKDVGCIGFDYCTAPREAKAKLAYLNKIHIIDVVITNNGDNLVWRAKTVISYNGAQKHNTNHAYVFKANKILEHPKFGLDQDAFLLIALFCGDYSTSYIPGMGIEIAMGLAQASFGTSLGNAIHTQSLVDELRANKSGRLPHKYPQPSKALPIGFPDMTILELYSNPLMSERVCYPVDEGCKYWKAVTPLEILQTTVAWDFNMRSHEKSISMPQSKAIENALPLLVTACNYYTSLLTEL
ncbi:hypothetical protein BU17DRAFT_69193 [Hysterangium stoloniferum]|nr:hypothetical protein BU17DRAFT_69193 [Hysterangium stoloniferum]